jgi:hypothetical protein
MAKEKLSSPQNDKASACIKKYDKEMSNRRQLIAKCLQMARQNRLTKGGSYIPVKKHPRVMVG